MEITNMITKVNLSKKVESFLKKAVCKDKTREVLMAVNANGRIESCDGFRYHAVRTQLIPSEPDSEALEGRFILKNGIAERVEDTNTYPDTNGIIPNIEKPVMITPDANVYFSVNAKYMAEALAGMDNDSDTPVTILITGPTLPIQIFGKIDGIDAYAIVMPMHNPGLTVNHNPYGYDPAPVTDNLWAGKGLRQITVTK
jgi:hypothetical protein